jgi:deoxyribonuclease V
MRLLALDVSYNEEEKTGVVGAAATDNNNKIIFSTARLIRNVEPYISGQFYKRELPCLKEMIADLRTCNPQLHWDCIVVDGYVWLSPPDGSPECQGLGARLYYEYMDWPVIGVAKSIYPGTPAITIFRGIEGTKPLYVTSVDFDPNEAAELIKDLPGKYKVPDLLREADRMSKGHT